jgi:hypothetical protein
MNQGRREVSATALIGRMHPEDPQDGASSKGVARCPNTQTGWDRSRLAVPRRGCPSPAPGRSVGASYRAMRRRESASARSRRRSSAMPTAPGMAASANPAPATTSPAGAPAMKKTAPGRRVAASARDRGLRASSSSESTGPKALPAHRRGPPGTRPISSDNRRSFRRSGVGRAVDEGSDRHAYIADRKQRGTGSGLPGRRRLPPTTCPAAGSDSGVLGRAEEADLRVHRGMIVPGHLAEGASENLPEPRGTTPWPRKP